MKKPSRRILITGLAGFAAEVKAEPLGNRATMTITIETGPGQMPNFDWLKFHVSRTVESMGARVGLRVVDFETVSTHHWPKGEQDRRRQNLDDLKQAREIINQCLLDMETQGK